MRLLYWFLSIASIWSAQCARGETKLDFWHSYIHQPSRVLHYSFQIARYKRGLFFGSCGPSTRSLQWEYDIDLSGPGPVYQAGQIAITSDLKKVDIASGSISIDAAHEHATFNIRLKSGGGVVEFPGNGTHPIKKTK